MIGWADDQVLEVIEKSDDLWEIGDAIIAVCSYWDDFEDFVFDKGRHGMGEVINQLSTEMLKRGAKRSSESWLRQTRDTAAAFEVLERRNDVPFSVHKLVRSYPDREDMLDWYEEEVASGQRPSVRSFEGHVKGASGPYAGKTFTTYRFYSKRGRLLYVGSDSNWPERRRVHAKSAAWWSQVFQECITHHRTSRAMRDDENDALLNEAPKHNEAGPRTHMRDFV